MITLSSAVSDLLVEPHVESFYMVSIGSAYASTTHYHNVVLSDMREFYSDGTILNTDNPQMTSVVEDSSYSLTLADPGMIFGA